MLCKEVEKLPRCFSSFLTSENNIFPRILIIRVNDILFDMVINHYFFIRSIIFYKFFKKGVKRLLRVSKKKYSLKNMLAVNLFPQTMGITGNIWIPRWIHLPHSRAGNPRSPLSAGFHEDFPGTKKKLELNKLINVW